MSYRLCILLGLCLASYFPSAGQSDTITVKNGISLAGTLKSFSRDEFTIETDFSENNIRVHWDEIKYVHVESNLLISDAYGNRYYGSLETVGSDSLKIITEENEVVYLRLDDLVFIEQIDEGFKHRFFFSIDVGFNMTQANNLRQWTSNSRMGYKANRWILEARFSGLTSSQDDTETIFRWDRNLAFNYILPGNWLINPELNLFTSTEQNIDLRIMPKIGIGKILVRTSSVTWHCTGGINMNFEDYAEPLEDRRSTEGFFGTELNLIDFKDLDFFGEFNAYPSFTESGRWRYDVILDLRYNLPLGFYITTGYTYNFDNKPTEGANGTDFILNAGIGWKW